MARRRQKLEMSPVSTHPLLGARVEVMLDHGWAAARVLIVIERDKPVNNTYIVGRLDDGSMHIANTHTIRVTRTVLNGEVWL